MALLRKKSQDCDFLATTSPARRPDFGCSEKHGLRSFICSEKGAPAVREYVQALAVREFEAENPRPPGEDIPPSFFSPPPPQGTNSTTSTQVGGRLLPKVVSGLRPQHPQLQQQHFHRYSGAAARSGSTLMFFITHVVDGFLTQTNKCECSGCVVRTRSCHHNSCHVSPQYQFAGKYDVSPQYQFAYCHPFACTVSSSTTSGGLAVSHPSGPSVREPVLEECGAETVSPSEHPPNEQPTLAAAQRAVSDQEGNSAATIDNFAEEPPSPDMLCVLSRAANGTGGETTPAPPRTAPPSPGVVPSANDPVRTNSSGSLAEGTRSGSLHPPNEQEEEPILANEPWTFRGARGRQTRAPTSRGPPRAPTSNDNSDEEQSEQFQCVLCTPGAANNSSVVSSSPGVVPSLDPVMLDEERGGMQCGGMDFSYEDWSTASKRTQKEWASGSPSVHPPNEQEPIHGGRTATAPNSSSTPGAANSGSTPGAANSSSTPGAANSSSTPEESVMSGDCCASPPAIVAPPTPYPMHRPPTYDPMPRPPTYDYMTDPCTDPMPIPVPDCDPTAVRSVNDSALEKRGAATPFEHPPNAGPVSLQQGEPAATIDNSDTDGDPPDMLCVRWTPGAVRAAETAADLMDHAAEAERLDLGDAPPSAVRRSRNPPAPAIPPPRPLGSELAIPPDSKTVSSLRCSGGGVLLPSIVKPPKNELQLFARNQRERAHLETRANLMEWGADPMEWPRGLKSVGPEKHAEGQGEVWMFADALLGGALEVVGLFHTGFIFVQRDDLG